MRDSKIECKPRSFERIRIYYYSQINIIFSLHFDYIFGQAFQASPVHLLKQAAKHESFSLSNSYLLYVFANIVFDGACFCFWEHSAYWLQLGF